MEIYLSIFIGIAAFCFVVWLWYQSQIWAMDFTEWLERKIPSDKIRVLVLIGIVTATMFFGFIVVNAMVFK